MSLPCIVCGRCDRPGKLRKSGFKCLPCIGKPHRGGSPDARTGRKAYRGAGMSIAVGKHTAASVGRGYDCSYTRVVLPRGDAARPDRPQTAKPGPSEARSRRGYSGSARPASPRGDAAAHAGAVRARGRGSVPTTPAAEGRSDGRQGPPHQTGSSGRTASPRGGWAANAGAARSSCRGSTPPTPTARCHSDDHRDSPHVTNSCVKTASPRGEWVANAGTTRSSCRDSTPPTPGAQYHSDDHRDSSHRTNSCVKLASPRRAAAIRPQNRSCSPADRPAPSARCGDPPGRTVAAGLRSPGAQLDPNAPAVLRDERSGALLSYWQRGHDAGTPAPDKRTGNPEAFRQQPPARQLAHHEDPEPRQADAGRCLVGKTKSRRGSARQRGTELCAATALPLEAPFEAAISARPTAPRVVVVVDYDSFCGPPGDRQRPAFFLSCVRSALEHIGNTAHVALSSATLRRQSMLSFCELCDDTSNPTGQGTTDDDQVCRRESASDDASKSTVIQGTLHKRGCKRGPAPCDDSTRPWTEVRLGVDQGGAAPAVTLARLCHIHAEAAVLHLAAPRGGSDDGDARGFGTVARALRDRLFFIRGHGNTQAEQAVQLLALLATPALPMQPDEIVGISSRAAPVKIPSSFACSFGRSALQPRSAPSTPRDNFAVQKRSSFGVAVDPVFRGSSVCSLQMSPQPSTGALGTPRHSFAVHDLASSTDAADPVYLVRGARHSGNPLLPRTRRRALSAAKLPSRGWSGVVAVPEAAAAPVSRQSSLASIEVPGGVHS
ncbi:hypothetical protein DIPPA_19928 [Diplonema papillatum]|nr:hypothetical protein DIPPA_19928 [Diplonema papillatum]